jgi:phosphoglycerol transferase MdoB-like AlkP superfamily enzyme
LYYVISQVDKYVMSSVAISIPGRKNLTKRFFSWTGLASLTADRYRVFWIAMLIGIWFLELLAIQECTSLPSDTFPLRSMIKYASCRVALNVFMCIFLVCILNRFWLYLTFALEFLVNNLLVVYAGYFGTPLSWYTIKNQWQEGVAVANFGLMLIQWPILLALLLALIIKVAAREQLHRCLKNAKNMRRIGWIAAACYLMFAAWLLGIYKPINQLFFGSPEYAYGYVLAWTSEAVFVDDVQILKSAIETAKQRSDHLASQEALLQLGDRLAVVQVESLGLDVLDAQVDGQWVMPFLHDLKTRSMFFVVQPAHKTGSSDADFTLLTDSMPNGRIAPFRIEQYPYANALPELARKQGFASIAMHGNTGSFFNRRQAYEKMGFSEIYFAEELHKLGCAIPHGGVLDGDVFRLSAQWMQQAKLPTIHFIVTLTSHGPFNRLTPEQRELFPSPANEKEAYLGCMRYVDRVLEAYLKSLPEGTVLVLYGDHESGVRGIQETPKPPMELVPWMIYRKGENLAESQWTRQADLSQSGQLHQLDLATFLHKSLKTSQDKDAAILSAGKVIYQGRPS